jgi:hypothetical protein
MAQKPYDKATPEEAKYAQQFNEFVRAYRGNNWQKTLEGYFSDAGFDVPGISPVNIIRVRELVTRTSLTDIVRNTQPLYELMPGAKTIDATYLPGLIESAKQFFEKHPEAPAVKLTGSDADYDLLIKAEPDAESASDTEDESLPEPENDSSDDGDKLLLEKIINEPDASE